jgi:hypothetical protein
VALVIDEEEAPRGAPLAGVMKAVCWDERGGPWLTGTANAAFAEARVGLGGTDDAGRGLKEWGLTAVAAAAGEVLEAARDEAAATEAAGTVVSGDGEVGEVGTAAPAVVSESRAELKIRRDPGCVPERSPTGSKVWAGVEIVSAPELSLFGSGTARQAGPGWRWWQGLSRHV